MKNSAVAQLATLLAFLSLIQPCPAPPAGVVGVLITFTTTIITAGALLGSDIDARSELGSNAHGLDQCVALSINSTQRIHTLSNDSVVISGLPHACMVEIEKYNRHPQIVHLNSIHGSTNVIGAHSVRLDNMPAYALAAIAATKLAQAERQAGANSSSVRRSS